ncbi:MAG TPA: hypothetical protein VKR61_08665 [Bryobacteraceae bacterium]|nr:hypothetical protein [Bryobacteraceae bacterium]
MNVGKRLTMCLALTALALGLTTMQASAEQVLKGTFELPAAAYWGDTLLQPGQYTIWVNTERHELEHVPSIHLNGEGVSKTFLAIAKPEQESGRNVLEVANVDGTFVVRAFDAGVIGESFAFGMTKSVRNKALRASAEPVVTELPVSSGAGF